MTSRPPSRGVSGFEQTMGEGDGGEPIGQVQADARDQGRSLTPSVQQDAHKKEAKRVLSPWPLAVRSAVQVRSSRRGWRRNHLHIFTGALMTIPLGACGLC